jgi:hypothetical protein
MALERAAHLLDPLPLTQGGAGGAAETERAFGFGQAEPGSKREGPVGGDDCLRIGGADVPGSRQAAVGGDKLGAGRLRLQECERFRDGLLGVWVAQAPKDALELRQGAAGGEAVASVAVEGERLLERLVGLAQPVLLQGGLGPALERAGPVAVAGRAKLERPGQVPLGLLDVETERPLPGQEQVAHRLPL